MFYSADNFSEKVLIKESKKNMLIYASRPFLSNNSIYFSYGYHDFQKKYIQGWYILIYDLENKTSKVLDISSNVTGFIENRPSSIAVKDNTIRVATSYLDKNDKDDYVKRHPCFELYNTVKILDIKYNEQNIETNKVIEKKVKLPYYGTSVYIDKNLNYVFFDEHKVISNLNFRDFKYVNFEKKMYPYIYQEHLFYVVPKSLYKMTNFNTDIKVLKIVNCNSKLQYK